MGEARNKKKSSAFPYRYFLELSTRTLSDAHLCRRVRREIRRALAAPSRLDVGLFIARDESRERPQFSTRARASRPVNFPLSKHTHTHTHTERPPRAKKKGKIDSLLFGLKSRDLCVHSIFVFAPRDPGASARARSRARVFRVFRLDAAPRGRPSRRATRRRRTVIYRPYRYHREKLSRNRGNYSA